MDKTKYSDFKMIIIFFLFAMCWAAKNILPMRDIFLCGLSGIVLGVVYLFCLKMNLPEYICRGICVLFSAFAAVFLDSFIFAASSNATTIIKNVYLPLASGAMFMDGLFIGPTKVGKTKAFVGAMSSFCLTIAIIFTINITGITPVAATFPVNNITTFIQTTIFSAGVCCFLALMRHIKIDRLIYIFPIALICSIPFNYFNLKGYLFTGSVIAAFMASILVGIVHRQGKTGYLVILTPAIYCCCPGGALHKLFTAILTFDTVNIFPCTLTVVYNAVGLYIGVMAGTYLMNKISHKKSQEFSKAY